MALADGARQAIRGRQEEDGFLDVRGEEQQVHDLGDTAVRLHGPDPEGAEKITRNVWNRIQLPRPGG